jgi:transposase
VELLVARCAGLDVAKDEVVACVRVPDGHGGRDQQVRTFQTFTSGLEALAGWLTGEGVTQVVMEATGQYWKPVWYLLEEAGFQLLLVNARHVKILPGRKTDVGDAAWLAELLEHGLLRGSFVPPAPIRELRDLTRYRKRLIQAHASEGQRIQKTLEDAGIKLDSVAADVLGASGRAMLAALVAGERDPGVLAELAKGRLRAKLPQLRQALRGRFRAHHALLVRLALDHLEQLEASIAELDAQVDRVIAPFAQARDRLDTITGVGKRAAECMIAEPGSRGALLRPGPLRTVRAPHRRTRLKQAPGALWVGVLASCACGLEARGGRRCGSSGFGCRPACRVRLGRRGARHLSLGG